MTVARCLYISCVHDSTLLWNPIDAPTTSHHVISVCVRSFTEIDHDATRDVIGVRYATPQPWHVLIPWSLNHVISHPSHLIILALHIHIIISMQVPCQSLKPICSELSSLPRRFSPIIPSIISSSIYTSSLPWFIFKTLKRSPELFWEIFPCPIDSNPLKIWYNFQSKSPFEFNKVNWIQIHWTKSSFEIQILVLEFKNVLGLKSLIWIWILQQNSKFPI
jgi:hypothetical protein